MNKLFWMYGYAHFPAYLPKQETPDGPNARTLTEMGGDKALKWLGRHENDIASDIQDYGDLRDLFRRVYDRKPEA